MSHDWLYQLYLGTVWLVTNAILLWWGKRLGNKRHRKGKEVSNKKSVNGADKSDTRECDDTTSTVHHRQHEKTHE